MVPATSYPLPILAPGFHLPPGLPFVNEDVVAVLNGSCHAGVIPTVTVTRSPGPSLLAGWVLLIRCLNT